jgi:hypothetical protein
MCKTHRKVLYPYLLNNYLEPHPLSLQNKYLIFILVQFSLPILYHIFTDESRWYPLLASQEQRVEYGTCAIFRRLLLGGLIVLGECYDEGEGDSCFMLAEQ